MKCLVFLNIAKIATLLLIPPAIPDHRDDGTAGTATRAAPIASRTRLGILALEDRVVPVAPLVSVAAMNDAVEDGTAGAFEFVRFGSTSGSLVISYSVSGTATGTDDEDYVELSGSVTIPSGQAVATVTVDAGHDGLLDPDETVIVTITESPGNYMVVVQPSKATGRMSVSMILIEAEFTVSTTSYTGTDTFTYTVEDDDSNTSVGTITVVVGTPAPTEVDGIVEDLEELEELIEEYDEDTPDELLEALPGLMNAITEYLTDGTETVSSNSPDAPGLNHSFKEFTVEMAKSVRTIDMIYAQVLRLEGQLWNATRANTDFIVVLRLAMRSAEAAAVPDGILIETLDRMITTSYQSHKFQRSTFGHANWLSWFTKTHLRLGAHLGLFCPTYLHPSCRRSGI